MRRLAVAILLAAGAHASTGGKPRKDLPPLFLVPSLCGSRIRAWSAPQCTIGSISPGTNTWVNPAMIGGQPYCWCECMRLWGPQMSDLPNCITDEKFRDDMRKMSSKIHSEDSDRRESRVMTTSTNSVLIGGAGPGAPMAPAVAVKPMSVDEKNRAIRARAVAEAKK